MKWRTLSRMDYDLLSEIQSEMPVFTFNNKGYEGIDRSKLDIHEAQADKFINTLLSKHIKGFSKFQNFTLNKKGEVVLRFQYDYDAEPTGNGYEPHFVGVGYLPLIELK